VGKKSTETCANVIIVYMHGRYIIMRLWSEKKNVQIMTMIGDAWPRKKNYSLSAYRGLHHAINDWNLVTLRKKKMILLMII